MRKLIITVLVCIFTMLASAQQSVPAKPKTTAPQVTDQSVANIDPAKLADIRRLLELSGAKNLALQTVDNMTKNMKPLVTNSLPPGEYREQLVDLFFDKFKSKIDMQALVDLAIPVYDKYFTAQEIKGLIAFYETPLGQKALSTLPKVVGELQQAGQQWGQGIGRDSMDEVLKEHPDLRKALEEAVQRSKAQ